LRRRASFVLLLHVLSVSLSVCLTHTRARTHAADRESLKELLKLEEESKKVLPTRFEYDCPLVRHISGPGPRTLVCFVKHDRLPELFHQSRPLPPTRVVSEFTGLPARYLDPHTRRGYNTTDEFRRLRERYPDAASAAAASSNTQTGSSSGAGAAKSAGVPVKIRLTLASAGDDRRRRQLSVLLTPPPAALEQSASTLVLPQSTSASATAAAAASNVTDETNESSVEQFIVDG
jgi:hypothetical protein